MVHIPLRFGKRFFNPFNLDPLSPFNLKYDPWTSNSIINLELISAANSWIPARPAESRNSGDRAQQPVVSQALQVMLICAWHWSSRTTALILPPCLCLGSHPLMGLSDYSYNFYPHNPIFLEHIYQATPLPLWVPYMSDFSKNVICKMRIIMSFIKL